MSTTEPVTLRPRRGPARRAGAEPQRAPGRGLGRRRQLGGLALAVVGLPLLTLALRQPRASTLSLESQVLLYLLAVVLVARRWWARRRARLRGGGGVRCINYFFVEPRPHARGRAGRAGAGAGRVRRRRGGRERGGRAGRAARASRRAGGSPRPRRCPAWRAPTSTRADTLRRPRRARARRSTWSRSRSRPASAHGRMGRRRAGRAGRRPARRRRCASTCRSGHDLRLVGRGPALFAEDQRVLQAFAAAAQTAYEGRRLSEKAREAGELATVDRQRTALLAAVGHDLRTPLAGIKAAVGHAAPDRRRLVARRNAMQLLATIEESADRLDCDRRQPAGRQPARRPARSACEREPVALDEVIGAAVLAVPGARRAGDRRRPRGPAARPSRPRPARARARQPARQRRAPRRQRAARSRSAPPPAETSAKLKVVDHGPGVPDGQREGMFEPFQRVGDRGADGVGLGLTVARGFTEAMGGRVDRRRVIRRRADHAAAAAARRR